jgi:iron complex transport system substrate-binding protein
MRQVSILIFLLTIIVSCQQKQVDNLIENEVPNTIRYAKGLSIQEYQNYTVVTISNPWPTAKVSFTYVLHKAEAQIPSEFDKYTKIQVPIKSIVVTSTTHIPALELLSVENSLVGFPNLDYISSQKVRALIDQNKVKELGNNQSLNTEVLLDLQPDVMMGFGIDGEQKTHDLLQKNGLKIIYNGDWTEQNPLGRAEWIKLFGILYGKEKQADSIFKSIENDYLNAKELAQKVKLKPTVLCGAIYQDQWFLPQGKSWAALFIEEANGDYLWNETDGIGSLALSFETVLDKAQGAEYWIGPGQFTSFQEMVDNNPNYAFFNAFKNKRVYSYSSKKGATGGVIYYELAYSRPDLVLKDLIKIMHPTLLPNYELYFFEQLK